MKEVVADTDPLESEKRQEHRGDALLDGSSRPSKHLIAQSVSSIGDRQSGAIDFSVWR